jgi:hypothetical protein
MTAPKAKPRPGTSAKKPRENPDVVLICGHVVREFGSWRSKGKAYQGCSECGEGGLPVSRQIIGNKDYTKYVVSRGTAPVDPWKDDCEPLF